MRPQIEMRLYRVSAMLLSLLLGSFVSASALEFSIKGDGNLKIFGDAGAHEEFTHLTKDEDDSGGTFNSTGRAYYESPVPFLEVHNSHLAASFNTCFEFQILNSGELNSSGEGLAFILAPTKAEPPANSSGMYLGLVNASTSGEASNHLFAVEFDSHASQIDPTNQPAQHIGVDINGVNSVAIVSLPAGLDFLHNSTFHAWIEYTGSRQLLEVRLSNTSERPEAALLSYSTNLAEIVQPHMYVGFSASTGSNSELHRLFAWNFSSYGIREELKCRGFNCKTAIILTCVIAGLGVFVGVGATVFFYKFCRKPSLRDFESTPLVHFRYSELSLATKDFSKSQLLGRGGFGKVYRADFRGGITLAVKVLTEEVSSAKEHEFLAELSTLGEVRHRNLVSLRGWCHSKGKPILVYDYMPNGSLDQHLFWPEMEPLSWNQRYEIIKGVAQAIAYLHDGREERIVHRDIKAANVLLDNDFTPKLGDFGLARLLDTGKTLQTMTRAGTSGYIAPELVYAGKATEKSDVYGFGILCMEMVTGRRTLDSLLQLEEMTLLDWLWTMHGAGKLLDCVDERLKVFDSVQVVRVLYMSFLCCDMDGNRRPTMKQCLDMLKETSVIPTPPQTRSMVSFPGTESSSSYSTTGAVESKYFSSSS